MTEAAPMRAPTREGVLRAAEKVAKILPATPLLPVRIGRTRCWAKAESLQPTGAFKIRGAWHRLADLSPEEAARGVVAVSSGNHAQGVAWAARHLGMEAEIVMPSDAPQIKIDKTRDLGGFVTFYDRMTESREVIAQSIAASRGCTYLHAFGDPWVIEGQGSAGIEIFEQMNCQAGRKPSRIIAPCGGGGLSAGLALACPEAEIVPVEPQGWDDVCRSLEEGHIRSVGDDPPPTACDALQTFATHPINFSILQNRCVGWTRVTEDEVRIAQRYAFSNLALVLEPGGAAALAAALAGKVRIDERTVIMLTGGNVDPAAFAEVLTGG